MTEDQIIERIKNPVSRDDLAAGSLIEKEHRRYISGENYTVPIKQLKGFESTGDYNIRKQLTKPGTVQLCAIILDNLNRWVTNQGTVKMVQFKQEKQYNEFKGVLNQVWRGKSMEDFIRTFYKDAMYQQSNGFIVVTKPQIDNNMQIREGVERPYDGGSLNPYMIFVASDDVHDYDGIGDDLEYIIIKIGELDGKQMYRVIDRQKDLIVISDGEKFYMRDEKPNLLGYVPAIQISSITRSLVNEKVKTSPIDHVLPALSRYLQKDSDLIIQMVRHMYPKLASVTTACKQCDGQGYYFDVETKKRCDDCNGTGKVIPISRDGIIGMPQYIDEGKTPYPGSPASYITPDNASLEIAIQDLKDLAKDIIYSATGDKNVIAESLNTATENLINFKGLEDRIADIVEMVESREEFLIKTIALMHNDFSAGFEDVSVRYSRRISLRGENEIINDIKASKEAGMPISHIESLQKELIYARYKNNKVELERQFLLADLEPLNGYTVTEVRDISEYVSDEDLIVKYNFNRLIDLFESKYGLIHLYKPTMEMKKRIDDIYNQLKLIANEVLQVSGSGGGDGGEIIPSSVS